MFHKREAGVGRREAARTSLRITSGNKEAIAIVIASVVFHTHTAKKGGGRKKRLFIWTRALFTGAILDCGREVIRLKADTFDGGEGFNYPRSKSFTIH